MKKKWLSLISIILVTLLFATGCGNLKTKIMYTYKVDTGDNITISLVTNDGYSLDPGLPFIVLKDGEEQSQGTFIQGEYYDAYVSSAKEDENAKIIDEGKMGICNYVMWSYNDAEYNYVIMINGTNTGLLLGNSISEQSAKECFDRLGIEIKK